MSLHEEQEVVMLSEICRVCLVKTDNMKHLLEPSDEIIQIITKLSSILNVEIEVNDILPCFLCNNCEEKLRISYDFQQLCQKSHNFILTCISASSVSFKVNSFKPLHFEDNSEKSVIQSLDNNSDGFISFVDSDGLVKKAIISCYSVPEIDLSGNANKDMPKEHALESCAPVVNENAKDESGNSDNGILKENFVNALESWAKAKVLENIEDDDMLREYPENVSGSYAQVVKNIVDENPQSKETELIDEKVETPEVEKTKYYQTTTVSQFSQENISGRYAQAVKNVVDKNTEYIEVEMIDEKLEPPEVEKKTKYNQTMRLSQFPREHVEKFIEQFRKKFMKHVNCLHCGFAAKNSRALSTHMTRVHKKMKEHWCFWCNDNFNNLQKHTGTVHKDNFKCPLCGKYTKNTGHFMEHLASHSIERSHVCRVCGKCFISKRHLRMHLRIHSQRNPYQCQVCLKVFRVAARFNDHLKAHNKNRCKVCDERFSTVDEYNTHKCFSKRDTKEGIIKENVVDTIIEMESKEISEKTPQNFCNTCNKRVRSLQKHLTNFHSDTVRVKDNKGVLCSYCGKRFKSVAKLTVHVRYHTGEMPYKCSYCDKRMTTRFHLVSHERTHTGEKPHKCNFCGKAFAQSSVLNTHLKQHTGRSEECFLCHKRFCRPSELKLHMRIHTGEKPFKCEICGQEFAQRSRLTEHCRNHTNERPYKCDYCDKRFKQSSTLRSHINIHLGRKPYKCSQCPYESRHGHCLRQHMSQHEECKPDGIHECEICCQNFTSLEMYSLHYGNEHGSMPEEDLIEASAVEVIDHLEEFT